MKLEAIKVFLCPFYSISYLFFGHKNPCNARIAIHWANGEGWKGFKNRRVGGL